jgi:hypothetical protein
MAGEEQSLFSPGDYAMWVETQSTQGMYAGG